jgi:hypothetical protein
MSFFSELEYPLNVSGRNIDMRCFIDTINCSWLIVACNKIKIEIFLELIINELDCKIKNRNNVAD